MTLVWQIILGDLQNYYWVIPITGFEPEENMVISFTEMFLSLLPPTQKIAFAMLLLLS